MLPIEAYAEAVAFLRLFDLSTHGLHGSTLAVEASSKIRWEEFPGLCFDIWDTGIHIYRKVGAPNGGDGSYRLQYVTSLTFLSSTATVQFVAAAFTNCIFEDMDISIFLRKDILDAILGVANCFIIKGTLSHSRNLNAEVSLNLVRKLRKIKVSSFSIFLRHYAFRRS